MNLLQPLHINFKSNIQHWDRNYNAQKKPS